MIHHLENWSSTTFNTPIELYFYGASSLNEIKHPILLIGGVHGDEPEGVFLAEESISWLLNASHPLQHFVLIPCLNPDGYKKQQRTNGRSVDLNRNYPSSSWAPSAQKDRYYSGTHAGSEREIQSLCHLIQKTSPRVIIHCHSWKPCIVCTGSPGLSYAQAFSEASQYKIVEDIGYETPGSLSHYGWHDCKIPVICIEESENTSRQATWKRFKPAIEKVFSI